MSLAVLITAVRYPRRCFSCSSGLCDCGPPRRRHDVRRRRPVRALPADPLRPPLRRLHVGRPQRQDSGQTRDGRGCRSENWSTCMRKISKLTYRKGFTYSNWGWDRFMNCESQNRNFWPFCTEYAMNREFDLKNCWKWIVMNCGKSCKNNATFQKLTQHITKITQPNPKACNLSIF